MSLVDRLRLRRRVDPRVDNDGLTADERCQLAAEYQPGAAAGPTAEQIDDLLATMAALIKEQQLLSSV